MAEKKRSQQLTSTSIIMWVGVFMLYAAIFAPLIPKIIAWPLWAKIVTGLSMLVFPLAAQIVLIYRYDKRQEDTKQGKR